MGIPSWPYTAGAGGQTPIAHEVDDSEGEDDSTLVIELPGKGHLAPDEPDDGFGRCWREEFPGFVSAVLSRCEKGRPEYAEPLLDRQADELLGDMMEELEDVAGWSFLLWCRLKALRELSARAVEVVSIEGWEEQQTPAQREVGRDPGRYPIPEIGDLLLP